MKILTAITYYYPHWTGLTAHAQRLAEGLVTRGHQVTVLTSRYPKDLARQEEHNRVRIVRLSSWLRLSRGQVMPGYVSAVSRLVREHDVVQVHTPMLEVWLVGILAHRAGRKMLMTHHGDLVTLAGFWNQVVQKTVGFLLDRGASWADAMSIHSQDYADSSEYLRRHAHKVRAIHPPVVMPRPDMNAVSVNRAARGLDHANLVGFAGRLAEEKGFDYLLKAIPLVVQRMPGVRFTYAGDRDVAYENSLSRWRHLVDANKEHLVVLGLVIERQELADFYAMCDVLALPSRTDCFPSVQVEAMMCGRPWWQRTSPVPETWSG